MAKHINGIAGIWDDEDQIIHAAKKVHAAGYRKFDTITPYPVHGMEEAMGIKRSWLPWVTASFGLGGLILGLLLQWWVAAVDWPINIGGKPMFSLPAFIPVTFETTVLLAALSSVAAMFLVNGLPRVNPPIIDPALTSHKFAIIIPDDDHGYNTVQTEKLLRDLGAQEIHQVRNY